MTLAPPPPARMLFAHSSPDYLPPFIHRSGHIDGSLVILTPAATCPAQELLLLRIPDEFLPATIVLLGFVPGHVAGIFFFC